MAHLICVLRLRADDDVHGCAIFQSDRFALGIDQNVSNTNSLTRIVSALNRNLNLLGVARNRRRNDLLDGTRQTDGLTMHVFKNLYNSDYAVVGGCTEQ